MFPKAGSHNVGCVESQKSGHCLSTWISSYGPRLTLHHLGVGCTWGGGVEVGTGSVFFKLNIKQCQLSAITTFLKCS